MKIAISATGADIEAGVDPRFGRCAYFITVDPETMKWESALNEATGFAHGAGIQAAQTVAGMGVDAVITGNVGPNAHQTLNAAGVRVFTDAQGSIRDAVDAYREGSLPEAGGPTVGGHSGQGGGMGSGRGRGRGR
jgi:predicted Fe-Mo cluster-binding NifX family protein